MIKKNKNKNGQSSIIGETMIPSCSTFFSILKLKLTFVIGQRLTQIVVNLNDNRPTEVRHVNLEINGGIAKRYQNF